MKMLPEILCQLNRCAWALLAVALGWVSAAQEARVCPAPAHDEAQAAAMLDAAREQMKAAGEHPMDKDLAVIMPLLRGAADAGLLEAQLRYGTYVYGYWVTDEMFWPSDKEVATHALAMLRVAALRIRGAQPQGAALEDSLVEALSRTPVVWTDDLPQPPDAWVEAAIEEADQWLRCRPDLRPAPPSSTQ
jgi:hypothetical protein